MESNLHPEMDAQKRRSTRIVQAVPLTVSGVDALGRPFQERTSSLIINCHGCRYQSKHYVLKNMWVTLEVPHNEAGREPRHVRGRVTWIQRPRTVRELFQIGVELEIPGNVWGIAFPPSDWFPFPETSDNLEIPAPSETAELPAADWAPPQTPVPVERETPEDNVRVLPLPPGGDATSQWARQVARVVAEAKQQLQGTVRETAAKVVAAETRPLIAALQSQLKDAAEKSVAMAVAEFIERTHSEQQQRVQMELEASVASMRAEWTRELDERIADARLHVGSQLAEDERSHQADFGQQVQNQVTAALEKIQKFSDHLGDNAGEVRSTIERLRQDSSEAAAMETRRWQELIEQRASEAQTRLAHLAQAAKHLESQIADVTSRAETGWRKLLETDLTAASARWSERMEASMEDAARRTAERLSRNSQAATQQAEQRVQQRISLIGSAFSQVTAEAENNLASLRAAISSEAVRGASTIGEMQQAVEQLEMRRVELDALQQKSLEEWARRSNAAVEAHSIELNQRAESAVTAMAERLQPVLEASGNETIMRLAGELSEMLLPEIDRAKETMSKLAFDREQSDKALAEHQHRIWQASERSVQDSVARGKELVSHVEKEFQESARATSAKWVSELEAKATETTHSTFEALFKSAEWYEKKVQNQMQTTLERGVDQAGSSLREKAGELSGLFASELDHYSRSYVEHAQGQIQDNAREAAEHAEELMAEAGEKAAANFSERAGQLDREHLELFASKSDIALQQNAARMESHVAQVRAKLENDTRAFAAEYQRAISQHAQQSLMQGKEELATQVQTAKDALRLETQTMDHQFRSSLQSLGSIAMDEHKQRLDNASNSWLLTTVTKLNQQSEGMIDQLAATTEAKLRAICGSVFAEMGETLRQRLTGFSNSFNASIEPAPSSTRTAPPENEPEDQA